MSYRVPGVYVDEVSVPPQRLRRVETGAALLIGSLPAEVIADKVPEREAIAVESLADFCERFMADAPEADGVAAPLVGAVHGFFVNGGSALWVALVPSDRKALRTSDVPDPDPLPAAIQLAAPGFTDPESHRVLIEACETRTGWFAILDGPPESVPVSTLAKLVADEGLRPDPVESGRAALYVPWLQMRDSKTGEEHPVPACGHVCGAIARNDADRGVHAAPANLIVRGISGLARSFSDQDQGVLNPAGVNAIRAINNGIRIWGARTLAPPDMAEWRFIPTRRLADMILLSVEQGLAAAGLDENSANTQSTVRQLAGDFLRHVWQDGMLQGQSPEDAYFVRCDESNNNAADVEAGRLNLEMGIAVMRPAEFVVLRSALPTRGV